MLDSPYSNSLLSEPHEHLAGGLLSLSPEYMLDDAGELSLATHATAPVQSLIQHSSASAPQSPASTLVGSSGGLQIDLIWDTSVRDSANWSAIESSVVAAAQIYTGAFSNHAVINIDVGFGEIDGSALASNALGESNSNGYITSYATVENALSSHDTALVKNGEMASNAVQALARLRGESFFVTSAEAKALGLVNATSTGIDGYIGLSNSSAMYFSGAGGAMKSSQYDATGVAAHEISEVMGRIGLEGQSLGSFHDVYTPLDIFRYSRLDAPDVTPAAAYLSTNDGATSLELFNNPANGGDAADWASAAVNTTNAYDAFDNPGVTTQVTATDLLAMEALGYQVAAGRTLSTTIA